jgi:hypothetical protein
MRGLPTASDREYVKSLMLPVTQPGKIARGSLRRQAESMANPSDFEYVGYSHEKHKRHKEENLLCAFCAFCG